MKVQPAKQAKISTFGSSSWLRGLVALLTLSAATAAYKPTLTTNNRKAGLKSDKQKPFLHTTVKNGKTIQISVSRKAGFSREGKPIQTFIKTIKHQNKPLTAYFRKGRNEAWRRLQRGACFGPKKASLGGNNQRAKECAEGKEMGRIMARSITYMAITQNAAKFGAQKKKMVDMDKFSDRLMEAVERVAGCIRRQIGEVSSGSGSPKQLCMMRGMISEGKALVGQIIEGAVLNGFKCDYKALMRGRCMLKTRSGEGDREKEVEGLIREMGSRGV